MTVVVLTSMLIRSSACAGTDTMARLVNMVRAISEIEINSFSQRTFCKVYDLPIFTKLCLDAKES